MDAVADNATVIVTSNTTRDVTSNVAFQNGTNLEDTVPAKINILEVALIAVPAITATILICSIVSLSKCIRLPSQLKTLSYNALITDVIMHVNIAVMTVCSFVFGESFRSVMYYPLVLTTMTMILISLASVAGLTLERLVALTKPMNYDDILSKRRVALLSCHIWLTHSILPIVAIVTSAWNTCNWNLVSQSCDVWPFYLPFRLISIIFLLIYHPFIIFSYLKITKFIHCHMGNRTGPSTARDDELQTVTQNIIRIVLAFEIIHCPMFVNIVVATIVPYVIRTDTALILSAISYTCTCTNSYFSIYTYVWKIKECRLMFLQTFIGWHKRSRQNAAALKAEVYNIILPASPS